MKKIITPFIYVLTDPREPLHFRYIGKTMNDVNRPKAHRKWIKSTTKGKDRHVANWVRKLHREGVSYSVAIIEYCPVDSTKYFVWEREQYYIKVAREMGHKLTNMTDGGPGAYGYKHTDEARAAVSARFKGKPLSPEHRAAVSAGMKGNPSPNKGKQFSPEWRAKISAAKKGKPSEKKGKKGKSPSPAQRASTSAKLKGKPWSAARRAAYEIKWKQVSSR